MRACRFDPLPDTSTLTRKGASGNRHALARHHPPDDPRPLDRRRRPARVPADHGAHPQAHVEGAPGLVLAHPAGRDHRRDRRARLPRPRLQPRAEALGERARQVLGEAAAGDMGRRAQVDRPPPAPAGRGRRVASGRAAGPGSGRAPRRRPAPSRASSRWSADPRTAGPRSRRPRARDGVRASRSAPRRPPRSPPGRSARARRGRASRRSRRPPGGIRPTRRPSAIDATNSPASSGSRRPHRQVVQEDQRPGAGAGHVVDAHRHEVLPQPLGPAELARQQELGAHSVGAGDEHRLAHAGRQRVGGREAGLARDQRAQGVGVPARGVEVDARVAVGKGALHTDSLSWSWATESMALQERKPQCILLLGRIKSQVGDLRCAAPPRDQ